MCGFAGILNNSHGFTEATLRDVACRVAFRGPDSTKVIIWDESLQVAERGNSGIFFNRLAIIDLNTRSDQPFERNGMVLVFNGEIYNYKELRTELEATGVLFETTSDTEVLFYVLRIWGVKGINKLNGMFAFFWINKNDGTFILARDRIGIKPLYYSYSGGRLLFGSELHSIVRLNGNHFDIDPESVKLFLWMQDVPTPYSILKETYKLPPGHYIKGSFRGHVPASLNPVCYWDAYDVALHSTNSSNPSDLEAILLSSLKRQLNADVPLGLFLSSGVDSSLLAALVSKHFRDRRFSFFTVAFTEDTPMDESREAVAFIKEFKNDMLAWHKLTVDPAYIGKHLDNLYSYYDEPFADYSSLMTWVVSLKAREQVTVTISGDGADELFWGYPRYNKWEKIRGYQVPGLTQVMRQAAMSMPDGYFKYDSLFALEHDPVRLHFDMFLSSGLRFLIKDPVSAKPIWATKGADKLKNLPGLPGILDLKTYLADTMLYKVDRSSMAASLEVRVPFLDNEVVDFALNLDFKYKSDTKFRNKAALKELLMKLAPHYDVNRKKRGFTFPMEKWLKSNWRERILENVTKENLIQLGLEPSPFLKIVNAFYGNKTRYFTDVWTIYSLIHWHQSFQKEFTGRSQSKFEI